MTCLLGRANMDHISDYDKKKMQAVSDNRDLLFVNCVCGNTFLIHASSAPHTRNGNPMFPRELVPRKAPRTSSFCGHWASSNHAYGYNLLDPRAFWTLPFLCQTWHFIGLPMIVSQTSTLTIGSQPRNRSGSAQHAVNRPAPFAGVVLRSLTVARNIKKSIGHLNTRSTVAHAT